MDNSELNLAKKIIKLLYKGGKDLRLYPPEHPFLKQVLKDLEDFLSKAQKEITFNIYDEALFYEEELLLEESWRFAGFVETCQKHQIESFSLLPGITTSEILTFLKLLAENDEDKKFIFKLHDSKVTHIKIQSLGRRPKKLLPHSEQGENETALQKTRGAQLYSLAASALNEIMQAVKRGENINTQKAKLVTSWIVESILKEESTLIALTALKNHDEYTCYHSLNVAILSTFLGAKIGLDKYFLLLLGSGALLHDIGKVSTPIEIINKPGPLTSQEWRIMQEHPLESAQILCKLPDFDESATIIAFEHHAGYNLSGYPEIRGIKKPHLFSRIVQIIDAYDGLTSKRSYHMPISPIESLNIMLSKSGTFFDPVLLKTFIQHLGIYPVGSVVELSSGEIGIVEKNRPDLLRPVIKIIEPTSDEQQKILDLSQPEQEKILVRKVINSSSLVDTNIKR